MFVEGPVRIDSAMGTLELGVVDADVPGLAEGVSRLLRRSIQDARAEVGGHLPGWLVNDIEQNYISPYKVRSLWAATGHRFALRRGDEIIGTIHIAKSESMILTVDRNIINIDESAHPGFKPPRHHHVVNISVLHELRRARLGTLMVDGIVRHFRHLFSGVGLWVRADPPWHPGLAGLGFVHDPSRDVFLPPTVERTAGLPHLDFNRRYACDCGPRRPEMDTHKLQYVSMTRLFEQRASAPRVVRPPALTREALRDAGPNSSTAEVARPSTVEEVADVLAWASRGGRKVTIRGQGQSYDAESLGEDVVLSTERLVGVRELSRDRVTVRGGTTWRVLLGALAGEVRYPPVVPSGIEASIGGTLASAFGGFGKGSLRHGTVSDHVESLLVVTGDGRCVACSATQARWLFEAVLSGAGAFGVIAEATLRLVEHPRFMTRSTREVDAEDVARALSDPTLEHASAERLANGRYRVFLTHPATAGIAIADHFIVPLPKHEAPRVVAQALRTAEDLTRYARAPGALQHDVMAPAVLRVHPRLERAERPGLLRAQPERDAEEGDAAVLFVTQLIAPPAGAPVERGARARVDREVCDERAARAELAKKLADPQNILRALASF